MALTSHRQWCAKSPTVAWLALCALIIAPTVVRAADGELVSRGGGSGAAQHQLPTQAIDVDVLPHTYLSAKDGHDDALPVYQIAPHTYFLYGNIAQIDANNRGFNGNAGFVVTPEGVVVIDALGTPLLGRRLIATVRQVTEQPIRYLIVTHNHPDHAYGTAAFRALPGVQIVTHEAIDKYLGSETFERSVEHRRGLLTADMQGFTLPRPDIAVGGERFSMHTIALGGKHFEIYNTGQHHSHGDLVVRQVEDGIYWISDLAFNQRTTFMGDGHSQQILDAQNWLLNTFQDIALMVPGHGSAQRPPFSMVTETRNYILALREKMQQLLDEGVSLAEAVAQSDIPAWRHRPLYEENHRANANFIYLELEWSAFN